MIENAERIYERFLVLRCQTGDEAAFAELVERYHPRLRYYLGKMLGDAHRAEDALQEVWFDVFRGIPRLADPNAFPAWLYRIARGRAARELRKQQPPCQLLDEAETAGAEENDFSAEDAERIHVALNELAPAYREVLMLRFLEEMSYDAIAGVTGCALGTVRSRIHYAKRALRRALERTTNRE
jgi:RNA polymerase sigma-70 factor (ECF subfamily)